MALKPIIAPSVLACDLSCLKDEAEKMIKEGCDWLHLDVMVSLRPHSAVCLRRGVYAREHTVCLADEKYACHGDTKGGSETRVNRCCLSRIKPSAHS